MDSLRDKIEKWTLKSFKDNYLFIVDIKIIKRKTTSIIVILDSDLRVSLDDCVSTSKIIRFHLDELQLSQDYNLEVTSSGIGQALKLFRQYKKNLNQEVKVVLKNGRVSQGQLVDLTTENISVQQKNTTQKNKKNTIQIIDFKNIKQTVIIPKL